MQLRPNANVPWGSKNEKLQLANQPHHHSFFVHSTWKTARRMAAVGGQVQVLGGPGPGEEVGPPQGMMVEGECDERDEFSGFKLPYPVATMVDLQQRAYVNESRDNSPEWLFGRIHKYCGISSDPTRLLRVNKDSLKKTFEALQTPWQEMHFRGKEPADGPNPDHEAPWSDHTLGSAGMLAFLLWLMKNKGMRAHCKVKALTLFLALAQKAMDFACMASNPEVVLMAMLSNARGTLVSEELHFSQQSICHQDWLKLVNQNNGARALWERLCTRCWLNRCISSSVEHASFHDILLFLLFIFSHQTMSMSRVQLWNAVGAHFLPIFLNQTAQWISQLAQHLARQNLQHLPELKTKTGRAKRCADPVSKLVLLWRLRKQKLHRQRTALTHDTGRASHRMMQFEAYIDCLLYLDMLARAFDYSQKSPQLSISWDPSTYGGKDTFIGVVYDAISNQAGYLPSQQLSQVIMSDLEESLLPMARSRKLTRLDGYKDLKGLSSSLAAIGLSIVSFKVPDGLFCRPLGKDEYRLRGPGGTFYTKNTETGLTVAEVPATLSLGDLPCLLSISDQGPNNVAALNFLMYSKQALLFWSTWDPFHRCWNDIKGALKNQCAMHGGLCLK